MIKYYHNKKRRHKIKRFVLIAIMTLAASGMFASGADFYRECVGCHGAKGEKAAIGASKVINAMSKDDITKALKDYKNDTYSGAKKAMMKGQVTKLSDAQILSAYIVTLK